MKWTTKGKVLAILAALALPALSLAQATGTGATGSTYGLQGGLANTPHDFTGASTCGSAGGGDCASKFVASTGGLGAIGLCTYCHTPHKAQSTQLLWNHTLSQNNFTWSDATTTTAGTALPTLSGQTYKGPSTKCLSCHDGSVAIGDVALYAEVSHNGTSALNTTKVGDAGIGAQPNEFLIANGGDLMGNHPIGVPYPSSAGGTYNNIVTGAGINTAEWQVNPVSVNSATANIRLFQMNGTGVNAEYSAVPPGTGALTTAGVECSSCHDPHNKQATDDFFLRGHVSGQTKADGYICLQCHIK